MTHFSFDYKQIITVIANECVYLSLISDSPFGFMVGHVAITIKIAESRCEPGASMTQENKIGNWAYNSR